MMDSNKIDKKFIKDELIDVLKNTRLSPILNDISGFVSNGKMLRGLLPMYISGSSSSQISTEVATRTGAAIEMIHAASLIHDDVIDNSELRRGAPSFWASKGVQGAILFGDLLICKAFKLFNDIVPNRISEIIDLTSSVCDAEVEQELITKGKSLSYEESISIAREKTGSLFAFAASCCGGEDVALSNALREAGYRLGTAYQLADDILDEFGSDVCDKPIGNDKKSGKITLANNGCIDIDLQNEITNLYNSYNQLLSEWPDIIDSWEAYLEAEFKPVISKFTERYTTR